MQAIQDSLVGLSLALIRFSPYPVLAWSNLSSIGLCSPGLARMGTAAGFLKGLAKSQIPFSFKAIQTKMPHREACC